MIEPIVKAKPKRKTRGELNAEIAQLNTEVASFGAERAALNARLRGWEEAQKAARKDLDELKHRLAIAESESQRMRGYISRVHEDDVVREELVPIGDPAGEHQLVPKRKLTPFTAPDPYSRSATDACGYMSVDRPNRPRPRHWVTY